jgi:hypothetical protein
MSLNLIIISRYNNAAFVANIEAYNLTNEANTKVLVPTSESSESSQVAPLINPAVNNIIIYDWSTTTNANPSTIVDNIIAAGGFDLVYLGKFLDTCSNYSLQSSLTEVDLVTGTSPVGFNAILLSPSFAATFQTYLNTNASKYYSLSYALLDLKVTNNYTSLAVSPNLFVYNPLYNSIDTSKIYSVKTTECEPVTSQITPPSDNALMVFWIILIIIAACVILFIILNYTTFGIKSRNNIKNLQVAS